MRKVFESMGKRKARAGGKSYTYYFTVESSVPLMRSGHAIELSTSSISIQKRNPS